MKKIMFTGGGSGGHVTLNLNLIPVFQKNGWDIVYVGSETGIEKDLIGKIDGVKYYKIKTGKLRRYFSWQNLKDAFKIPLGICQAAYIIHREKPDIIFSKGGFVSFPVVVGGFLNRRKIFMHESDLTPGLANKMSLPFVDKFFTTFIDTVKYVRTPQKVCYIGPVLSDRLKNGDKNAAFKMCDFSSDKPIVMFVGGSLGAQSLNKAVAQNIDALLQKYQIIHICGKGQKTNLQRKGYAQFEFVDKEFKDLLAATDIVVTRSGSNAIFEFWSLNIPMLLVPLPSNASRGEQSSNAQNFQSKGFAEILPDKDLSKEGLLTKQIDKMYQNLDSYRANIKNSDLKFTSNEQLYREIVDDQTI